MTAPPADARPLRIDLVGLGLLVAALALLWGRAAGGALWADEAISTGLASRAFTDIPGLVRQESAPPLYYLVLHVWMSAVGSSDTAVHALSLLFAVATVPAALWAGWSLFGRRAGWTAAALAAISPFLSIYSHEARMYTLVVLLAVVAAAAYVHAFVFRRRAYLVVFAAAQILLLYTHNWALLFLASAGAALVPLLLLEADKRRFALDAAMAFGAVALAYVPWLPSLVDQVGGGLQPWGAKADLVVVRQEVVNLLGGADAFLLLGVGAALGFAAVAGIREWTAEAAALAVLVALPAVVVVLGWRVSVWHGRYLAVVLPPLLLLVAAGLARGGNAALALLAVAVFLGAPLGVKGPPHEKSNARAVAHAVAPALRPGDLVVVPDPHLVPVVARYLPAGLRYATTWGEVSDEHLVEWDDFMERLAAAEPSRSLVPLVATLPPGAHVAVFCMPFGDTPLVSAPVTADMSFDALRGQQCVNTTAALTAMPVLRTEARITEPGGARLTALEARLLTKVG